MQVTRDSATLELVPNEFMLEAWSGQQFKFIYKVSDARLSVIYEQKLGPSAIEQATECCCRRLVLHIHRMFALGNCRWLSKDIRSK